MADERTATAVEVLRAGQVLFGPAFAVEGNWRDHLKRAFRRRAFETHPDRALALGREARELAREFRELRDAFELLSGCSAIAPPPAQPPRRPGHAKRRTSPRPGPDAQARRPAAPGPGRERAAAREAAARAPPPWKLRFGEFLYHTGRVPWSALVEAIAWQRRQRPPLGRIAVESGFLTEAALAELLWRRARDLAFAEPLGQYAIRTGFLTRFQLLAALGRQQARQRRIGQFFVDRGFITAEEVSDVRHQVFRHNARWGTA